MPIDLALGPSCWFFVLLSSSQGFWEQGKKDIYFKGTGEHRPNFEGNRGTKTILGTGNIMSQVFHQGIYKDWTYKCLKCLSILLL